MEGAPNITQVRILNGKSYREFQVEVRVHVHTCVCEYLEALAYAFLCKHICTRAHMHV